MELAGRLQHSEIDSSHSKNFVRRACIFPSYVTNENLFLAEQSSPWKYKLGLLSKRHVSAIRREETQDFLEYN